jgi:hypothetical protein
MKNFDDSAYRNKPGFIYLIHAKDTKRYKVGLTTRTPEQRLAELNSSQSPYPLELIKVIETNNVTETESYLHKRFALQRRHGEWFEFNDWQLREVITEFERLESGNQASFRFPAINLPTINLLELLVLKPKITISLVLVLSFLALLNDFSKRLVPKPRPINVEIQPTPQNTSLDFEYDLRR